MSRLSLRSPKCHRNLQPRSATRKWLHVALPDGVGHWRWQCWLQPRALRRGCGQGKKNGQQLGLGNNRNTEAPAPGLVLAGRIQYRPHSYNHTLTMGLVWAGSELRTLAPWPPLCMSTMSFLVQWPQYRLLSLSTKHANIQYIQPQYHITVWV